MGANNLVRSVFGFSGMNIQALVDAVELAYSLVFVQGRSRSAIRLNRDIYTVVAEKHGKKCSTVVRQLERLCNTCWDKIREDSYQMERLVGPHPRDIDSPSEVIFFLACYLKYKKPFEEVMDQDPP